MRVIMAQNIEMFCIAPPHPNPLPQGERGFRDKNYLCMALRPGVSHSSHSLTLASGSGKICPSKGPTRQREGLQECYRFRGG